jgi:hypothetical protein
LIVQNSGAFDITIISAFISGETERCQIPSKWRSPRHIIVLISYSFDVDDVLEVDDELWSLDPDALPPVQPQDITPKLRVFNQSIALMRISGRCLQTVVSDMVQPTLLMPNSCVYPFRIFHGFMKFALDQTKRLIGMDGPKGLSWMINDINSRLLNWAHGMPFDREQISVFRG